MFEATVVITTRNRKDALRDAIESALAQSARLEILVVDDASTDGTCEMVESLYPGVRLHRSEQRLGLIVQRNAAARLASAPIIFSLDDDAVFTAPDIAREVIALFANPLVGAVSIPHKNIIGERVDSFCPPVADPSKLHVTSTYIGCAHALRRDLFLELGGYFEKLFHWGEETGYCQRLYDSGHAVAVYTGGLIHHYPHPQGRHTRARNLWIYRNYFLIPFYNAPGAHLAREWALALGRCGRDIFAKPAQALIVLEGMARGIAASLAEFRRRRPVSAEAYDFFVALRKRRAATFEEAEGFLRRRAAQGKPVAP